ncbi:hypothetical protein V8G54_028641 [Vigna mungo]|uniref:Uncharacterized protein n=1 Tax=Vigna mungo TaxID=3915 RepID=A0AAQ3RLV5_VIGMU
MDITQFNYNKIFISSYVVFPRWSLIRRGRRPQCKKLLHVESACQGNACSTERAIGIALKPNIYAINVKHMTAIWYNPEFLIFLKLIQANSTFSRFSIIPLCLVLNHRD